MEFAVGESVLAESEGSWEVPEGWCWTQLGTIASLRGEKVSPEFNSLLPFVGMDDIEAGGTSIIQTRPFGTMKSAGNRFFRNDVLYGRLRPYLNKTALAWSDGACSGELLAIVPAAAVHPKYLQFFMHARRFVNTAMSTVTGDRPRIDFATIAAFDFPLPPLAEQKRIVARIDALFAEIAEGEAALAAAKAGLDTFRRALLKSAVTGELTKDWRKTHPPTESGHDLLARIKATSNTSPKSRRKQDTVPPLDTPTLPELPEAWAWGTIKDVASVIGGLTKNPGREKMPEKSKYLRVANVQAGYLDLGEVKEIGITPEERQRTSLISGDLLVVEGNGSIDQIGRCALWQGEIANCVHQNHIIKVRFADQALPNWCINWLLSPHGRQEIEQVAASTSGLHTLSISKIAALPIPIPPPAEATEILRRVSEALAAQADTLSLLKAEAADAARLKQSILKSAFEGRLVPQDPRDEPASALLARVKAETAPSKSMIKRRKSHG